MENIGDILLKKIHSLRKSSGLTQSDAADKIGISLRYYQQLEKGANWPSPDVIDSMCRVFKVSPEELFGTGTSERRVLSPSAITGPVTVKDGALILSQIADISPERRAFVLAVLFDDESLIPDEMSDLLDPVIQRASTIR